MEKGRKELFLSAAVISLLLCSQTIGKRIEIWTVESEICVMFRRKCKTGTDV